MADRVFVSMIGMLSGWAWVAVGAGLRVVRFSSSPPPLGIVNRCWLQGYPKPADYFWFCAMLVGGLAGGWLFSFIHRTGWGSRIRIVRVPGGRWLGGLAVIAAILGSVSDGYDAPAVLLGLAGLGTLLPWLDPGFGSESSVTEVHDAWTVPRVRLAMIAAAWCLALAFVWTRDPCRAFLPVDGFHEGNHLLWIQGFVEGDVPGLDSRTYYGPLFTYSMSWWMRAFGATVHAERGYFMCVQALGTGISLWVVWLTCSSLACRIVGAWLMLALTFATSEGFGSANMLRTALPMLAITVGWTGIGSVRLWQSVVGGVLAGSAMLYSQEFGFAAVAASICIFLLERPSFVVIAAWVVGIAAGLGGWMVAVFGGRVFEAATMQGGANYALAHLLGVHALPLGDFRRWQAPGHLLEIVFSRYFLEQIALRAPGWLACGVVVWLGSRWRTIASPRRSLLAGIVVFTLIAQVPVLVRPLIQIGTSAAAFAWLIPVVLDVVAGGRTSRRAGLAVAQAVVVAYGLLISRPSWIIPGYRWQCLNMPSPTIVPGLERLGAIGLAPQAARLTADLVREIQAHCPPGGRLIVAAPGWTHLAFLSDRAGLRPFASPAMTATADERKKFMESVESFTPPVALLSDNGPDVPLASEHPDLVAYVHRHYTLLRTVGDLQVWVLPPAKSRLPAR